MQSFLTHEMANVSATLANRVNSELGLAIIGTRSVGETTGRVAALLKTGGRSRSLTVIRTELGRAYSVAGQQRMEQAAEVLPGPQETVAALGEAPGASHPSWRLLRSSRASRRADRTRAGRWRKPRWSTPAGVGSGSSGLVRQRSHRSRVWSFRISRRTINHAALVHNGQE